MIMREERNNDIESYFLDKTKENEKNSRRLSSFSLFNMTQKQDLSLQDHETNKKSPIKDTDQPKGAQEKIHTQPTFFPPPKVMDMEVNQENKLSKTDGSADKQDGDIKSDNTVKEIFETRDNTAPSTLNENNDIVPSVEQEVIIEDSEEENEPVSIREEIFMMLEEELEEQKYLHVDQENHYEKNGDSNDAPPPALEEEMLYSDHEFDHNENHLPSFSHYLETIYCEKNLSPLTSKETDFVHCIGSLTSVLKKISTERETIMEHEEDIRYDKPEHQEETDEVRHEHQEDVEETEPQHPNLTALKELFENELFSEEQHLESGNETTLPDSRSLNVKIPVVLSTLQMEVAIFKDVELPFPIEHILSIHWSIQSLKTNIPLPAGIVFVKGTLVASIQYVNPGETASIHSINIPIQWDRTIPTPWIFPPKVPKSEKREYTFMAESTQEPSTHHECHHSFCEPIEHFLQDFTFISHHEPFKQNGHSTLKIQGCLQACLHLTQEQFVHIQSDDLIQ
ncbi:hypothetical protein ABEW00_20760 [Rossellomorea vietnamensis]|uniref:hypothetical protein n=1 Tax=Rossellomorea vietnamensis TaxID=218284 RepID=UPI003D2E1A71